MGKQLNLKYASGNYARTFTEIFYPEDETKTSFDMFKEIFDNSGIPLKITEDSLRTLFYLLYAAHGSDYIAGVDENQFKYGIQSRVFMYGPSWEKRLEIQDKLRALSLEEGELFKGSEAIYNSASAPGTAKSNLLNDEGKLGYLNGQNTTEYRKSKIEGYASLLSLLETDVTKEFLNKFKDLFQISAEPAYSPYFYEEEE